MRLLILMGLLCLLPAAQACSIATTDFDDVALDGDTLLTDLAEDAVRIDLTSGEQTLLAEDYFPRFAAAHGWHYVAGQTTLDADCSGDGYLRASQGTRSNEGPAVQALDAHEKVAILRDHTVHILDPGQVDGGQTFSVPPADTMFPTTWRDIAIRDRVAVTLGAEIHVHTLAGATVDTWDLGSQATLAWWGDTLVAATTDGQTSTFHLRDVGTLVLTSQAYAPPRIAAGTDLYLQQGEHIIRYDGDTTHRLVYPVDLVPVHVAADGDAAVILFRHSGPPDSDAAGILRLADAAPTAWLARDGAAWRHGAVPDFTWDAGPAMDLEAGGETAGGGEGRPQDTERGIPAPVAPVAVLLAAVLRRHHR